MDDVILPEALAILQQEVRELRAENILLQQRIDEIYKELIALKLNSV